MPEIYIIKTNGEREIFDYKKLEHSLRKIGTNDTIVADIIAEVARQIKDNMTTREIYRMAYSILRKKQRVVAVRYSLKKAVASLGPTGFPFEKFIAEIFKSQGLQTETNRIVAGKCVDHEIDIAGWDDKKLIFAEAKFHTDFSMKSDLKVALYIKARYDDLMGQSYNFGGKERPLSEGWLITNTKFSGSAIQYGECARLNMVGWNYPYGNNLHNMIERAELIPLTALTSINTAEKNMFLARGIVLSKDLLNEELLRSLNFNDYKIKRIKAEVYSLCEHCQAQFADKR